MFKEGDRVLDAESGASGTIIKIGRVKTAEGLAILIETDSRTSAYVPDPDPESEYKSGIQTRRHIIRAPSELRPLGKNGDGSVPSVVDSTHPRPDRAGSQG